MGNMDEGLHYGIEWKALEVCSSGQNQCFLGFAVANLGDGCVQVNLYDRKLRMLKRTKDRGTLPGMVNRYYSSLVV